MAKKTKIVSDTEVAPVKPKKADKLFHLIVECNGNEFSTETDSLLEAIQSMPVPPIFKTETIFRVTKGAKTIEKVLKVFEARRVFANDVSCEILAINLTKMLP